MRLFRIQAGSTDIAFSADGQSIAAPSDVEGEVVIQKLVANDKGKLPPESRVFVGEGVRFLGWQAEKSFRLFCPADEDGPARIVARSLVGRSEEVLFSIGQPAMAKDAVIDPALRFVAPHERSRELDIVELRTGRAATFMAKDRTKRLVVQRFAAGKMVLAELSPNSQVGTVHLVDPLHARPLRAFENAAAVVPAEAGGMALVIVASSEDKKLRAEWWRLGTNPAEPTRLAEYPLGSKEALWLLEAAPKLGYRPLSPDGSEIALPDGDGSARMLPWRPRARTAAKFFRAACYDPKGKWLAGPGAGISVEATFLCVEAINKPPGAV